MKIVISISVTFLSLHFAFANQTEDSLRNKIEGLSGKEKMEVLLNISQNTRDYAPQMSIDFGQQYLDLSRQLGDREQEIEALKNLGRTYYNLGDFDRTIQYFINILRLQEERDDKPGLASAFNSLGYVYSEIGRPETALDYYQRSLLIKEQLNDSAVIASTLSNIGRVYINIGEPDKAFEYFARALAIDESINNQEGKYKSLNNIGLAYKSLQSYDSALYYFAEARKIIEIVENKYDKADVLNNISDVYVALGNYNRAIELYNEALNLGTSIGANIKIQETYRGLSDAYAGLRYYQLALQYYQRFSESRDSLYNEASSQQIARIETDYRIQKREKEIELLKKEAQIRNLNLEKNKAISYYLSGGLVLFFVLVAVLYSKYQFKIRSNKILEKQNREIANKNLNIMDSIMYAKGIQEAILPDNSLLDQVFQDAFIFCQPRDIVNGDFFWFAGKGNYLVMAAVDCTGHGVPGAFMTVMGNSMLNQIVLEQDIFVPSQILHELNQSILNTLHQDNFNTNSSDGMDMAVCLYDTTKQEVTFSGAKRPLYYFKDRKFNIIKGNNNSVGGTLYHKKKIYDDHTISLGKDDTFYLFSDGITDQFGENLDKKFMNRRWQQLLEKIQDQTMDQQCECIKNEINDWMGNFEQTDDMLVIGVRV